MPFVLCQEFPFGVPRLEYFLQLSGIQDFLELIEILLLRVEHFLSSVRLSFLILGSGALWQAFISWI